MINAFCQSRGWLFDDLKRHLGAVDGVTVSDEPIRRARAWICIRSSEINRIIRPAHTVLQVHDVKPPPSEAQRLDLGHVTFTHPVQQWIWRNVKVPGTVVPIGARDEIAQWGLPERPTIGFFCREVAGAKGSDLFAEVVRLVRQQIDCDVLMIGDRLGHIASLGTYETRAAGPDDYRRIDVLFCASRSPAVPLSVYEASAAGCSVVTTDRWFPGPCRWPNVKTGNTPAELAQALIAVLRLRGRHPPVRPFLLSHWVAEQVRIAREIAR